MAEGNETQSQPIQCQNGHEDTANYALKRFRWRDLARRLERDMPPVWLLTWCTRYCWAFFHPQPSSAQ